MPDDERFDAWVAKNAKKAMKAAKLAEEINELYADEFGEEFQWYVLDWPALFGRYADD